MNCGLILSCAAVLWGGIALGGQDLAAGGELVGKWEKRPLPPSKHTGVHSIGIEPGGVLWAMANNLVYYWAGQSFRELPNAELRSGFYLANLWGGGDRRLYASQKGRQDHQGRLYELVDGQAVYETDFYYEVAHGYPGLYVSKSGRLFNWGKRFLAVYIDKLWNRIEVRLSLRFTVICDLGEEVYFYYNQQLYWVDGAGNFGHTKISCPVESVTGRERIHGALWGSARIFLLRYGGKEVYAYNLKTGEAVDMGRIISHLAGRNVYDVFAAGDGSIWLLVSDRKLQGYFFLRITPNGAITTIKETLQLAWDNSRCWQFPRSVLNASDGSIWFGSPQEGIARYHDAKMQLFGWRDGLSFGNCRYILEGIQGRVYAASHDGINVFRPGKHPATLPPWPEQWQEYRLGRSHPIRDSNGNIWMFLEDHPQEASRWDGHRWHHMKVDFKTTEVNHLMADDQGHILLDTSAHNDGCYDISPGRVRQYENMQELLLAAVRRGVKQFFPDDSFQGCIVQEGEKIWFGYHNRSTVYYYDAVRWDELAMNSDIHYLYDSPRYGMLLQTQGQRYYTYDRGQFVWVEITEQGSTRWLLGARHLQPYEETLLTAHPEQYVPVERDEDGKLYLLVPCDNGDKGGTRSYRRGRALHHYLKEINRGWRTGHWSSYIAGPIFRFFGTEVIRCDWHNTPLLGRVHQIREVTEDRARNLWIDAGFYSGARHVFVKRMNKFELSSDEVPGKVKYSVTLSVRALLDGAEQPGSKIFWRFEGDRWQCGEAAKPVTIDFPEDGRYEIEMVGMGPLGGLTANRLHFSIEAAVPLPETVATEAVPSQLGREVELAYRTEDSEYRPACEGAMVLIETEDTCKNRTQGTAESPW